ncbi:MAG: HPr family phosphocarrier protein [Clostridia bacterium]|nr:HPr family phosphocarrier protein [Clostridia bacterium]
MIQFSYTVKDGAGIHARPAGALIKLVRDSKSRVTVKKDGKEADAAKIFTLMALGVKCGDTVIVEIEGEDEEMMAANLKTYMQENL